MKTLDILLMFNKIQRIIIWQGSLEVNPSIVIGSFLVEFCHTDHFHGNSHKLCFVALYSWQIQNLQPKRVPYNKLLTNLQL